MGLEKVLDEKIKILRGLKIGLICNQASVNHNFQHASDLFSEHPGINLTALFGPQHGIRADVQDNMIETSHSIDESTKLPVYSLYSETRQPTKEMLANLDALVVDLQDVGCRVYTFIYTMANAMKACAKFNKKIFVLDRPNPLNGIKVEGNILEKGYESFVGQYPIPMRHALTIGEMAKLFNEEFGINCDLEVIEMDNWARENYYDETDAPWVLPSPNMPTVSTAVVFPGTVFFEGTQVSEGRGTTKPFEIIGAPYINSKELGDALNSLKLGGVIFQPISFLPSFQKHSNKNCNGVFIHVVNRELFEPVITGIAILKTIFDLHPNDFEWKIPPYEYVYDRNPFDVIAGTTKLRSRLESMTSLHEIKNEWQKDINKFSIIRNKYLLY
ncbi:MAG: DUF1343 domain-containing protein [Acidobacteriota bacterium]|nr:DUF1343 domain-containing protein [Acidobacteriota bacterium]